MTNFVKKSFSERMLMKQQELERYYRELRKQELETNAPIKDKSYYEKKCDFPVPIVPVAIAFYGRRWYVSYGKEIRIEPYANIKGNYDLTEKQYIKEQSANLRDAMATLKWELIREYSGEKRYKGDKKGDLLYTVKRSMLNENSFKQFIDSIMKDTDNGYGIEEIEATRFKDRSNPEPKEIEKDMEPFRKQNPAFFLASNERFINYINVCNSLPSILENLDEFRSRNTSEIV